MLNLFSSAVTSLSRLSRPSLQAFSRSKNSLASWAWHEHDARIFFHLGHLLALRREQLLPGLLGLGAGLDPLDQVLHQLHPASHPVLGDTSQTHISPPPTLTFSKSDKIRGTCCAMRSLFIGLIINCILTESQSFGRCQRICWKDDQPSICSKEHCCLQDKVRSMLSLASYVSFTLSNYKVDLSSYSFLPLGSSDDQLGTELEWQWTTFDIESKNHGKIRIWNLMKFRLT